FANQRTKNISAVTKPNQLSDPSPVKSSSEMINHNTERNDSADPLFKDAAHTVIKFQQASASLLQRQLKISYSRATKLLDTLEEIGIIGPFQPEQPRQVLVSDFAIVEKYLNRDPKEIYLNNLSSNSQLKIDYATYLLLDEYSDILKEIE